MSEGEISLVVEKREVLGKAVKHLRKDGMVPAVIHNHGGESTHVVVPYVELLKVYRQAGKHHPVSVKLAGKDHLTIIKDVDFEPRKNMLRHVVFNAIRKDQTVEAEIPVHIVGDIPAEKASLMVITGIETVEVEALPHMLPDELTVDGAILAEVGDKIHVSDITAPEGVKILSEPEEVIAHVEMPKDQIAEADKAAEELAADKAETEGATDEGETTAETPAEGEAAENSEKTEA